MKFSLIISLLATLILVCCGDPSAPISLSQKFDSPDKYPFNDKSYELATCNMDLDIRLTREESQKDLYKVLVLNRNVYEYTVTAFMVDFTRGLKEKGWFIVDSGVVNNSIKEDLFKVTGISRYPDIIVTYNTEEEFFRNWPQFFRNETKNKVLINWVDEVHSEAIIKGLRSSISIMDAVFARYPLATLEVMKPYRPKCFHIAHAATDTFFNEIRTDKTETALLSGQIVWPFYPLREEAYRQLESGNPHIVQRTHPGYKYNPDPMAETKDYAEEISGHLLAISGGSLPPAVPAPFVLAKHFEIPAAGTALVTDVEMAPYLREFGFIPGENYITTDRENLSRTIAYWLDPLKREQLLELTKRGQELVRQYHRNQHRIEAFDRIATNLFHIKNAQQKNAKENN